MSDKSQEDLYDIYQQLTTMSPQEQTAWFDANASRLSKHDLEVLARQPAFSSGANGSKQIPKVLGSSWYVNPASSEVANFFNDVAISEEDEAAKRLQSAASGQSVNLDLDGDGTVEPSEKKAVAKATDQAAKQNADDRGVPEEQAKAELESVVDGASNYVNWPSYLTSALGGVPDQQTVTDLINKWNELNPDMPITPGDQTTLAKRLAQQSNPVSQHVVESVLTGEDPVMDYRVTTLDGKTYTIQSEQFAAAQQVFQGDFSAKELTFFVRQAAKMGLDDANGVPAWQVMAALARAQGLTDPSEVGATFGNNGRQATQTSSGVLRAYELNQLNVKASRFKIAQSQYGNFGIAFLAAVNPQLAMRLAGTPYENWDQKDILKANQLFVSAGIVNDTSELGKMDYVSEAASPLVDISTAGNGFNAGQGSNGGSTRTMPDPVALRQSAKDMYKQMFLADPTDAQLDSFVASVQGQMKGAPDDQQVDGGARLRELLERNPQYNELYGKMPPGMSETEYQGQFRAGAQSMLGNEAADPNNIRSGMRQGQYQTTIGAVAGSKQAWNSSSFLGRLAVAAQAVADNT